MKFDLEERCQKFGENIIQLLKSATSIGANYMEANAASSIIRTCEKSVYKL